MNIAPGKFTFLLLASKWHESKNVEYSIVSIISLILLLFHYLMLSLLSVGEFLGKSANGTTVDLALMHVFYPQGRFSPFVSLGTGMVHTDPNVTLVQPENRTEQTAFVGGGFRYYLWRRFLIRGEFREHEVFTHRNENQQVDEWKLGFAFFF